MTTTQVPHWHATFSTGIDESTGVLYPRGELELFTVEYLRGSIEQVRRSGRRDITLDLSELTGIDRTAADYLVRLSAELAAAGGSLVLIKAREPVLSRLQHDFDGR